MSTSDKKSSYKKIMGVLSRLSDCDARTVLDEVNKARVYGRVNAHSKTELDRELYEFILSMDLEFLTQKQVRLVCIDKFGLERAPSRSALSRIWKKLLLKKTGAK